MLIELTGNTTKSGLKSLIKERHALEAAALKAISTDDYYELLDNLSITTDAELLEIIDGE